MELEPPRAKKVLYCMRRDVTLISISEGSRKSSMACWRRKIMKRGMLVARVWVIRKRLRTL